MTRTSSERRGRAASDAGGRRESTGARVGGCVGGYERGPGTQPVTTGHDGSRRVTTGHDGSRRITTGHGPVMPSRPEAVNHTFAASGLSPIRLHLSLPSPAPLAPFSGPPAGPALSESRACPSRPSESIRGPPFESLSRLPTRRRLCRPPRRPHALSGSPAAGRPSESFRVIFEPPYPTLPHLRVGDTGRRLPVPARRQPAGPARARHGPHFAPPRPRWLGRGRERSRAEGRTARGRQTLSESPIRVREEGRKGGGRPRYGLGNGR